MTSWWRHEFYLRAKIRGLFTTDCLDMEAYRHSERRLCALLCILFNMCMKCGYVPYQLRSAIIVPLLKCKSGDLSDVNNYRAITVSNSISKIFESLLSELIMSDKVINDYQFNFQKSVSTALCNTYSRVLLTIIGWMAVTFSAVLLTLERRSTAWTIGYCSVNSLIVTVLSHALLLLVY